MARLLGFSMSSITCFYVKKAEVTFPAAITIKHESTSASGVCPSVIPSQRLIMHLQFLSLGGIRNPGCGHITNQKNFNDDVSLTRKIKLFDRMSDRL